MCMCLYMICYVYAANQRWGVELYRGRMKLSSITMHRGGRQLMFADVQLYTLTWLAVQALLKVCLYQKRNIVKAWLKALVKYYFVRKIVCNVPMIGPNLLECLAYNLSFVSLFYLFSWQFSIKYIILYKF